MPLDYKRNPRPESSVPYQQFCVKDEKSDQQAPPISQRPGGRQLDHLRPMFLQLGTTYHAEGSCYLELGRTKVTAAVYGPKEVPRRSDFSTAGQLTCELKFAPFSCRRRRGYIPDNQERELSQTLHTSLEPGVCLHQFPKSVVDVYVYVLEEDGAALAAATVAASAALADANIPMYDLVASAALRHANGTDVMDPTSDEVLRLSADCSGCHGDVTVSYMPQLQQVTCLYTEGVMTSEVIDTAVRSLTSACQQVHAVMRERLLQKARRPVENGKT